MTVIEIFASIGVVKIAKYEEDPLWGVAVFPVFRSMNITKIAFGTYYIGLVMMVDFLLGSASRGEEVQKKSSGIYNI